MSTLSAETRKKQVQEFNEQMCCDTTEALSGAEGDYAKGEKYQELRRKLHEYVTSTFKPCAVNADTWEQALTLWKTALAPPKFTKRHTKAIDAIFKSVIPHVQTDVRRICVDSSATDIPDDHHKLFKDPTFTKRVDRATLAEFHIAMRNDIIMRIASLSDVEDEYLPKLVHQLSMFFASTINLSHKAVSKKDVFVHWRSMVAAQDREIASIIADVLSKPAVDDASAIVDLTL